MRAVAIEAEVTEAGGLLPVPGVIEDARHFLFIQVDDVDGAGTGVDGRLGLAAPDTDPEESIARVRSAGRWLAKLHAADAGSASVPLPAGFEAKKLASYATALAETHPALEGDVRAVAEAAATTLEAAAGSPLVLTHGDYQPKNIYVGRRRTTVIDFDRHALAPAARDLAHFMGQCMTMSWVRTSSFERIRAWNEAFLEGYGETRSAGAGLLNAYLARTFLEVLYYKLVVKPVADPGFAPAWLARCEEWLAGELPVPPG